jgi:hypothetical protein
LSDNFSWAPFGSSRDDELEPLPPLPAAAGEDPPDTAALAPVEPVEFPVELGFPAPPDEDVSAPPPPPPPAPMETPWGSLTAAADIVPDKRQRPPVKGGGEAVQALIWGILGLTFCPILIPSVAAVRLGAKAKAAGGGLGAGPQLTYANWGITLGWIGIIAWAGFIALGVAGALIT